LGTVTRGKKGGCREIGTKHQKTLHSGPGEGKGSKKKHPNRRREKNRKKPGKKREGDWALLHRGSRQQLTKIP